MTTGPLFNPIAALYERYAELNDEVYRPYLERALPGHGARGIDLGCGSGRFTGLLARRCAEVVAVDLAEHQIALARARRPYPNVTWRVGDLLDVRPAAGRRFDLVLSVNALFNLYRSHDPAEVGRHVRALVAPGGCAVIVDVVLPRPRPALRHRWWGVRDALGTWRRRRRVADVRTVLRLRQHPVWMTHVRRNDPLDRADFHRRYAQVFPGAEFTDDLDPFVCALRWHNPVGG